MSSYTSAQSFIAECSHIWCDLQDFCPAAMNCKHNALICVTRFICCTMSSSMSLSSIVPESICCVGVGKGGSLMLFFCFHKLNSQCPPVSHHLQAQCTLCSLVIAEMFLILLVLLFLMIVLYKVTK